MLHSQTAPLLPACLLSPAGEAAADAARSIAAQISTLEAQAAGHAEELRELQGMKQVRGAAGASRGLHHHETVWAATADLTGVHVPGRAAVKQ